MRPESRAIRRPSSSKTNKKRCSLFSACLARPRVAPDQQQSVPGLRAWLRNPSKRERGGLSLGLRLFLSLIQPSGPGGRFKLDANLQGTRKDEVSRARGHGGGLVQIPDSR